MSAETMPFRTELKQLLHLIIHSLYSHKDIFLRELISNASDAIDRVRFEGLTRAELLEGNEDWKIKLIPDPAARTLTVADNGAGMSRETIVEQLGTIARSGTREFLDSLRQADAKDRPELIGQFGVGFYSAFMVADRVTVRSRMAGRPEDGVEWQSDGQGSFTIEPCTKPARGTDVILHLKEEDKDYLQPWQLTQLVKKYSDFIAHPIVLDVEKEEDGQKKTVEETLNARQAIWLRNRAQVTQEEYHEFYRHLAHDTEIGGGAVIEPYVVFGPKVRIEGGAAIRAFSHIEQAVVRKGAIVGPYARLRPGADIGANAHVGNFVEVKNVKVGEGAKLNHLTYVGDGSIGARANLGAGTIFCNYDGFDKFETHVGADAFIGSDTALVAPVRVGDGAFTGTGSVITQDVPANALALGRSRQVIKEDWASAFRAYKKENRKPK